MNVNRRFFEKNMTAKDHAKILGIIFLIFGGLGVLVIIGMLIFLIGMGGIAVFNTKSAESISISIAVTFLIFGACIVFAGLFIIPQIIAGLNLLKGNGKSKILVIISGIINVLNFPIGTAIGIYAFGFTFSEEGKRYFRN